MLLCASSIHKYNLVENPVFFGQTASKPVKRFVDLLGAVGNGASKKLFPCLSELKSNNAQGEYYLTDVPSIMLSKGYKVGTFTIHDDNEVLGVNTPEELALCESILK